MRKYLLLPAIIAFSAGTALAQDDPQRQVTVDLQNVMPQIAAGVTAETGTDIPSTVNVPATVAQGACNIDSATLTSQLAAGSANCMAVSATPELMQIVEDVMVAGYTTNEDRMTTGSTEDDNGAVVDDGAADDGSNDGDGAADDGGTTDGDVGDDGSVAE